MSRLVEQNSTQISVSLPPEIWETIFDYVPPRQLPKLRLVCRYWRDIVTNCPMLMEKITFTIYSPLIACRHNDVEQCPSIAKNLLFISVRFVEVPPRWSSMAKNWTYLDIGILDVSLSTLLEMLRYTVNLKQLKIGSVDVKNIGKLEVHFKLEKLETLHLNSVTDASFLCAFEQLCPNLKNFYIGMHHNELDFDEECVIKFVQSVQSTLKNLTLFTSTNFLAELSSFKALKLKRFVYTRKNEPEQRLARFCRTQPFLEQLRTARVVPRDERSGLTNSALCEIGRNLPNLKHLSTAIEPDSSQNVSFLGAMANLEYLSLISHRKEINFSCCQNFNLTELYLGFMRPIRNSLSQLLSGCPNLKNLNLRNISFGSWSELFTAIKPLKLLQSLELWSPELESQTLDCPIEPMENLHSLTLIEFKMAEPVMAALFRALLSKPEGLRFLYASLMNLQNVSKEEILVCDRNYEGQLWKKMKFGRE